MIIKRFFLLMIALIILCWGLSSCFPSYKLTSTAMIQAFGIDAKQDGSFDITLQIFEPQGTAGVLTIDPTTNNASLITVNGKTISEAVDKISALQSEYPFTGQNRMIIIGKQVSEQNIQSVFQFFERNQLTRPNIDVLMAENTAKEILEINLKQGMIAAQTIEKTLVNSQMRGNIIRMPYLSLIKSLYLHNGSGFMPVISKKQLDIQKKSSNQSEGEGEENENEMIMNVDQISIKKMAIFSKGQLMDVLNENLSKGLPFLRNTVDKRLMVITDETNRLATLNIYHSRTKLKPELCGDNIVFVLQVRAKASVEESNFQNNMNQKQLIQKMSDLISQQITQECEKTFEHVVQTNKIDLFELKTLIQKKYPKKWKDLSDDFDTLMPTFQLKVVPTVTVDRVGVKTQ